MRLAAHDDRPLSECVRRVLERHGWGHVGILDSDTAGGNDCRALQRDSAGEGTR